MFSLIAGPPLCTCCMCECWRMCNRCLFRAGFQQAILMCLLTWDIQTQIICTPQPILFVYPCIGDGRSEMIIHLWKKPNIRFSGQPLWGLNPRAWKQQPNFFYHWTNSTYFFMRKKKQHTLLGKTLVIYRLLLQIYFLLKNLLKPVHNTHSHTTKRNNTRATI